MCRGVPGAGGVARMRAPGRRAAGVRAGGGGGRGSRGGGLGRRLGRGRRGLQGRLDAGDGGQLLLRHLLPAHAQEGALFRRLGGLLGALHQPGLVGVQVSGGGLLHHAYGESDLLEQQGLGFLPGVRLGLALGALTPGLPLGDLGAVLLLGHEGPDLPHELAGGVDHAGDHDVVDGLHLLCQADGPADAGQGHHHARVGGPTGHDLPLLGGELFFVAHGSNLPLDPLAPAARGAGRTVPRWAGNV